MGSDKDTAHLGGRAKLDGTEDTLPEDSGSAVQLSSTALDESEARVDHQRLRKGELVDRYEVQETLGSGGMGVVYRARDQQLNRDVALKVLQSDLSDGTALQDRLLREAQAMARLSHENLVTVHDVGTCRGRVFLAMEYIKGSTLKIWLEQNQEVSWQDRLALLLNAGRGVAAAHAAGVIHRDFKPENVMVAADGKVQVVDFGLARGTEELDATQTMPSPGALEVQLTATGAIMGTPAYMSPEQHKAKPVDERTDQFSFAVVVYEALYGNRPFSGDTLAELACAVESDIEKPPVSDISPRLFEILKRALAPDPQHRFPSMSELLSALEGTRTAPQTRKRLPLLVAAVIGVAGTVGAVVLLRSSAEPPVPTQDRPSSLESTASTEADPPSAADNPVRETADYEKTGDEIMWRVVRANSQTVDNCYQRHSTSTGSPESFEIVFEIGYNGSLLSTRVRNDDSSIGTCIASASYAWAFPGPQGDNAAVVSYQFRFGPRSYEIKRLSSSRYELSRAHLADLLRDAAASMDGVRTSVAVDNNEPSGVNVFSIRRGSPYEALGLTNGDTLRTADGIVITDLEQLFAVSASLEGKSKITLAITRGGKPLELKFAITDAG